jgi:hypothetical protein
MTDRTATTPAVQVRWGSFQGAQRFSGSRPVPRRGLVEVSQRLEWGTWPSSCRVPSAPDGRQVVRTDPGKGALDAAILFSDVPALESGRLFIEHSQGAWYDPFSA